MFHEPRGDLHVDQAVAICLPMFSIMLQHLEKLAVLADPLHRHLLCRAAGLSLELVRAAWVSLELVRAAGLSLELVFEPPTLWRPHIGTRWAQ